MSTGNTVAPPGARTIASNPYYNVWRNVTLISFCQGITEYLITLGH